MPHEYTKEEMREKLQEHIAGLVDYWDKESRVATKRAALDGLAFSILAALDGEPVELPSFALVPLPRKSDREFCESRGESWYPYNDSVRGDIGGDLHGNYYEVASRVRGER